MPDIAELIPGNLGGHLIFAQKAAAELSEIWHCAEPVLCLKYIGQIRGHPSRASAAGPIAKFAAHVTRPYDLELKLLLKHFLI